MKIIKSGYQIIDDLDGETILKKIERVARVCYKSEDKIGENTAEKLVAALIKSGHEAMLEHYSFSVLFTVDRGISHELVRHRLASFAQESTRFCNYSKDGFGNEITVIKPSYFSLLSDGYTEWKKAVETSEKQYFELLSLGYTPQEARAVLPNSLKTDIVVTANLREWRHILNLRAVGTTGKPHPQMTEVMIPLLKELQEKIPIIFDDLQVNNSAKNK